MNQEDAMKMISRLENLSYNDREGERSEVVLFPQRTEVSQEIPFFSVGNPHHQENQTQGSIETYLEPKEK